MTQHLDSKRRTEQLLDVALTLAAASGLENVTRDAVAQHAGVSPALVSARLGTMESLRRAVMRRAVAKRCVPVVAQGLATKDKHAAKADEALRALAAEWVRQA